MFFSPCGSANLSRTKVSFGRSSKLGKKGWTRAATGKLNNALAENAKKQKMSQALSLIVAGLVKIFTSFAVHCRREG